MRKTSLPAKDQKRDLEGGMRDCANALAVIATRLAIDAMKRYGA
jgi:hypothetical protein